MKPQRRLDPIRPGVNGGYSSLSAGKPGLAQPTNHCAASSQRKFVLLDFRPQKVRRRLNVPHRIAAKKTANLP
jgi:hypothetical protein